MQHKIITRYDVEALLDNELSWKDAKDVMQHLENDRTLAKYYQTLRQQKKQLQSWWANTHND